MAEDNDRQDRPEQAENRPRPETDGSQQDRPAPQAWRPLPSKDAPRPWTQPSTPEGARPDPFALREPLPKTQMPAQPGDQGSARPQTPPVQPMRTAHAWQRPTTEARPPQGAGQATTPPATPPAASAGSAAAPPRTPPAEAPPARPQVPSPARPQVPSPAQSQPTQPPPAYRPPATTPKGEPMTPTPTSAAPPPPAAPPVVPPSVAPVARPASQDTPSTVILPDTGPARVTPPVQQPLRTQPAQREVTPPGMRRVRKAKVMVRKFDPWAVLRFSLVFYFCMLLITLLAVAIIFTMLKAFGAIDNFEEFMAALEVNVTITGGFLFKWVFLLGLGGVVIASILTVFMAFLYNLIADVVGGIEIQLTERD